MRTRKLIRNILLYFVELIAATLSGFIIPRMILKQYGSNYNGLISSISQFLEVSVLLRAGIGGATMAALYKPLENNDSRSISAIYNATQKHMRKIGMILLVAIVMGALLYPGLIDDSLGTVFTFNLFIIIGISSFAESFFGITNYIILSADQRIWVTSILKTICYLLNTVFSCWLIRAGASILFVKAISTIVYVIYPVILKLYVTHHYKIDYSCPPDVHSLDQRWDAFFHQVSNYIMNNTDIIILSMLTNLYTVSVYSVYYLVISGVKKIVLAFSNGLEASYGNMIAKKEYKKLRENFGITETIINSVATVFYTCTAILIIDFVTIYTRGIEDVQYREPLFAYIFVLAQYFLTIRIPYQFVTQANGNFRETKVAAIFEPFINVIISIVMVFRFGLVGVVVGTLVASVYRTIHFSVFSSKNIVTRSFFVVIKKICIAFLECSVSIWIAYKFISISPSNYFEFIIKAVIVFMTVLVIVIGLNYILLTEDMKRISNKLRATFKGR